MLTSISDNTNCDTGCSIVYNDIITNQSSTKFDNTSTVTSIICDITTRQNGASIRSHAKSHTTLM
jgi:hypothetical protein